MSRKVIEIPQAKQNAPVEAQQLMKDCASRKIDMRSGKAVLNHTHFLGYTKGPNGILQIVPEEAEIVRKIFALYIQGNGVRISVRPVSASNLSHVWDGAPSGAMCG